MAIMDTLLVQGVFTADILTRTIFQKVNITCQSLKFQICIPVDVVSGRSEMYPLVACGQVALQSGCSFTKFHLQLVIILASLAAYLTF